ncbi:udp-glucose 6-dehydrogenase [Anaeramoeba ignava]|uniref:UDP-glucose 6-dehydrogenase n=1 Tax=Anaeramoeba ignava TaxID=1746090 RepID=A0A9Q0L9H2_ANAIG|nr:udp-glucose 6-dehydrogenase [Anaeramoeba ignava]|eukprot:Anaeramoba_ignava/a218664_459.p1 GENE.a218664_459~~a218664_459.p1  ORF type:complete len:468 (+),score=163.08 a218664_459:20-1423(+)
MEKKPYPICCLGAGYVGVPTMAVICEKNPDIKATVFDVDEKRIAAWKSENLPFYEPDLEDIIKAKRDKSLFFSTDAEKSINEADLIYICVGTPTKTTGIGAGMGTNLTYIESTARMIAKYSKTNKIIVEKSTVPVQTSSYLEKVLKANAQPNVTFEILSNPEFMAEGSAIRDLRKPDRVVIGGKDTESAQKAIEILKKIYCWVDDKQIVTTNLFSSELIKLTANAFLAQRVSSINAIAEVAEVTGANVHEIARGIGLDSRIGPKFLGAGIGFGGSCFQKDLFNLIYLCEWFNLKEVVAYWKQVVIMNDHQRKRFVMKILNKMFNNITSKKISVLGFAFKKDTSDTRESPAIYISDYLIKEGAHLSIYDPKATKETILRDLQALTPNVNLEKQVTVVSNAQDSIKESHAILILTDWDEFKELNLAETYKIMEKPAYIFDGRNVIDQKEARKIGFETYSVGTPLIYNSD